MSEGSDIEMQSALPKKTKKMPKQPKSPSEEHLDQEPKKISTKIMIHEALNELKSRKGTSLYAIKKFIAEKHKVDIEKINYIIKKLIKTGVEAGTIVQTKGVGASGSFKLAPEKKLEKKKPKPKKMEKKKKEKSEKSDAKKPKEKIDKNDDKLKKDDKQKKAVKKNEESKLKTTKTKEKKTATGKVKKMAKEAMTPAKKRAMMMKRKSIGSIIKPPKMKPKGKS